MIQIRQSSIASPVFVRLIGNQDQDNWLKLERETEFEFKENLNR